VAGGILNWVPMALTPRHETLLEMLARLDQQMADAAALMVELKEGSAEHDAASAWLAESTAESFRVTKLLAELDRGQGGADMLSQ
jgi:hypothetical protein